MDLYAKNYSLLRAISGHISIQSYFLWWQGLAFSGDQQLLLNLFQKVRFKLIFCYSTYVTIVYHTFHENGRLLKEIVSCQGRSSTKIVGESKCRKSVGHHDWPMEKILGFKWPATAQMALNFFFRNISKYVQGFPFSSKQFLQTFFFTRVFLHKIPQN